jgi:hypothetical protein
LQIDAPSPPILVAGLIAEKHQMPAVLRPEKRSAEIPSVAAVKRRLVDIIIGATQRLSTPSIGA